MHETLSTLKEEFSRFLSKLNVDVKNHAVIALLVCQILSPQIENGTITAAQYSETVSALNRAHIRFGTSTPESDFLETWPLLSSCFSKIYTSVGKRPRRFLVMFQEPIVADWDALQEQLKTVLPTDGRFTINALATIYYFTHIEEEYRRQSCAIPPYDFYLQNKIFPNSWFVQEFSQEVFDNIWNIMFYFPLEKTPVRINKDLRAVIDAYDKYHIPHGKILGDYAVILNTGANLPAINEWQTIKRRLGQDREYGIAVDEGLFDIFATKLKRYTPTEVVSALFYRNSKRNDSAFESGVLTKILYSQVKPGNVVYLVNPSPFMLTETNNSIGRTQAKSIVCIVNGSVLRDIYQRQFPNMQFVSFDDQVQAVSSFDVALVTTRDWPVTKIGQLLEWCLHGSECAVITACIPRILVSSKKYSDICQRFLEAFSVKKIVSISNKATNSYPKNKLLIFGEKMSSRKQDDIILQDTELNGNLLRFKSESLRTTSIDSLIETKPFLMSKQAPKDHPKRNRAKEIPYSKEITLYYTTKRRGDSVVGRGYYCQRLAAGEEEHRSCGKRLTKFVEKGLRCKSEEEVIFSMLHNVPYFDEIAPHIIFDIHQQYQNRMGELSLKTVWFCSRPALMKRAGYDDTLSRALFEGNNEIADIKIGAASLNDYICLMLPNAGDNVSSNLKYWQQLNLLLNHAEEEKYIVYNPVREHMRTLVNYASEEEQEVRNALVKKTFTLEEERKIIRFLSRNKEIQLHGVKKTQKLLVVESIWLIGPIRLYTGLSVREACALTWGDYLELDEIGLYQFAITKLVDDNGNTTSQVPSPEKTFRKVPVVRELAIMLQQRKNYLLQENGISARELANMPIILENEKRKKSFCRPTAGAKASRQIISAIGIPPNTIQLPDEKQGSTTIDLNQYFGDIFRSNFRHRAKHTARLNHGEINYILAVKAPDTFSKHYCDYLNEFIQLGMAEKLHRWAEQHSLENPDYSFSKEKCECKKDYYERVHSSGKGIIKLENTVEILPDDAAEYIDVTVSSSHGILGNIDYWREG